MRLSTDNAIASQDERHTIGETLGGESPHRWSRHAAVAAIQ